MDTIDAHMIERLTAYAWVTVALLGICARSWRLWVLYRIEPKTDGERRYLRNVIRSSYFRFAVKTTLLVGGLQAAFGFVPGGFWIWRFGVVIALLLLLLEDLNVTLSRRGFSHEYRETS